MNMCKNYTNKLLVIALMIFAITLGSPSCSEDEPEYVKVTGITVTPDNAVLLVNNKITLVADVFPRLASDKRVTWASDNTSVATVSDEGEVTGLAEGVANVSVTSVGNGEKTKTCTVTVVTTFSVTLNATSLLIPVEATRSLTATIIPSNVSQEVTWTSDNVEVVSVVGGVITAVAPGTATITADSVADASRTAECEVTVVDVSAVPAGKWLAGMWTFEDAGNLGKATVGYDLEANGNIFNSIPGPGNTKAVKLASNSYYTIRHNIGANGGGDYVNEYTLMMDIMGSASEFSGWLSVFNNKTDNAGEGVLWIDGGGRIGYAGLGGYSSTGLTPDVWHRVVIAAKLGDSFRAYIDGTLVWTASNNTGVDGMMSLLTDVVYIGYDGTGYPGPSFADVKIWSIQLTDEQISALGTP
jgi:uncharacterized protein YjdB